MDSSDTAPQPQPSRSSASSRKSRGQPGDSRNAAQYGSITQDGESSARQKSLNRRSTARRRRRRRQRLRVSDAEGDDSEKDSADQAEDDEDTDDEPVDADSSPESPGSNNDENDEEQHRIRRRHRRRSNANDDHASDGVSMNSTERRNTLKDRQDAINKQHPFGLPLWKPALYKKSRSVVRKANSALHSSPSSSPQLFLHPGNILWLIIFGWWLALVMFIVSLIISIVPPDGRMYGLVMREFAFYLLWPFGRYVERLVDIEPTILPELVQSPEALEAGNQVDEETTLLQGHRKHDSKRTMVRALMDTLKTGPAGCVYFFLFFTIVAPLLFVVSAICWMCVITIPMAKLNYILMRHLRRHPLSLRFRSSPSAQSHLTMAGRQPTVILLCTYQAIGWQYYKYTYDGINIMFINLMPLVFFVIFDDYVIKHHWPDVFVASPAFIFGLSLASVIPLSYFIGMGVSSVSAQSSMGVGAVINATFGSIIEIILYAVALMGGKSALVEGSLIGSILAGVLLLPGCSMISGGIKRKEQKFNSKSAGVTATMLIMAIIGALSPTLFYQMFGSFELRCVGCPSTGANDDGTIACTRCYWDQMNPTVDPVYLNSVKPFMWICAAILPSAYMIGLVFSLHTHVDMVWKSSAHEQNPGAGNVAHGTTYQQKFMPTHIISQLIYPREQESAPSYTAQDRIKHHAKTDPAISVTLSGNGANTRLEHQNDTSATVVSHTPVAFVHAKEPEEDEEDEEAAGHDSPNWGKTKSFTILFACTILYSIIAEILVETVDLVMDNLAIDEKFLGLTLFALVPNITEFMNAISFALYGNIVLSMEIGSAYALQVCLIQIPAMVAFSLWYNWGGDDISRYTFNLVFPRWDVISVIFSVFLLTYTYQEGKSNYFKGSILILSYCVLVAGFYYIPSFADTSVVIGFNPPR